MARCRLNGVDIEYENGGSGPAVLLTHGFASDRRTWAPQRTALEPPYRLITWDMRGHGQSQSPDDPDQYSEERSVEDMRALLGHLGLERAVIGGLSLGGYMSLAFHHAYPDLVRALVICDAGPGYRSARARAAWNLRAYRRARNVEPPDPHGSTARAGMQGDPARGGAAPGGAHAARGMLAHRDSSVIDSLPGIRVPTLIIVGERDTPFRPPSEYMAQKIPGARLEVIADAGHISNRDQPAAFNRVLRDFLDSLGDA